MSLLIKWMVTGHCVRVAWLQITRLIIINPSKFFNFSRALVVMFETSTLSLDQGKSIAIFGGDHLVQIISSHSEIIRVSWEVPDFGLCGSSPSPPAAPPLPPPVLPVMSAKALDSKGGRCLFFSLAV